MAFIAGRRLTCFTPWNSSLIGRCRPLSQTMFWRHLANGSSCFIYHAERPINEGAHLVGSMKRYQMIPPPRVYFSPQLALTRKMSKNVISRFLNQRVSDMLVLHAKALQHGTQLTRGRARIFTQSVTSLRKLAQVK